jgi:NADH:ubiquinone oxidoreductase subunit C
MFAATQDSKKLGADYIQRKNHTEALNSKLNQILQIIQALVNSRIESLKEYYGTDTGVNQVNTYLDTTRTDLLNHAKLLKNKAMEKDLKSAMVDYTVEKNSSSRNMLAVYGFMNIVAAGLIFYLYRSSKSQ